MWIAALLRLPLLLGGSRLIGPPLLLCDDGGATVLDGVPGRPRRLRLQCWARGTDCDALRQLSQRL